MAAAAILNLFLLAIFKYCRISTIEGNYHTKFRELYQSTTELYYLIEINHLTVTIFITVFGNRVGGGKIIPQLISGSSAAINEIPTATSMFSGCPTQWC